MLTAMACCPLPTGRGPWQRTPAGNGGIGERLAPENHRLRFSEQQLKLRPPIEPEIFELSNC